MTTSFFRQLANPCGRTSLRLDLSMWTSDARDALIDIFWRWERRHLNVSTRELPNRSALAPNGTPLYGKRTLRNPSGYLR
jgi:hypothetical protein